MFQGSIYRERALAYKDRQKPADALRRITAPHEWLIVVAILASMVAVFAVGAFWRVPVSLFVEGVLLLPGERVRIVAAESGRVLDVGATEGQTVRAGAVIATVAPSGLETRLRVATAKEALLADLAAHPEADPVLPAVLAAAQAERLELSAMQAAGVDVSSSRAGEITALYVRTGDLVEAGATIADIRLADTGPATAAALLRAGQTRNLRSGLPVRIAVQHPDENDARVSSGKVLSVSDPGQLPAWLHAALPATSAANGAAGRLVRVAIDGDDRIRGDDLMPVRLEIVLDRATPLAMLVASGELVR